MGLVETEAIILRTYKLAEADKIAVCLTREAGIIRGVARGARRLKSRFGASLEPFTLVDLSYFEKEGRELVSFTRTEILRSYFSLAQQPESIAALEYMSELAIEFAPPHQPDEKLFRMVRACVEALAEAPANFSQIIRYYETWMLKLSGFLPALHICGKCDQKLADGQNVYLTVEGSLHCGVCAARAGRSLSYPMQTQLRNILVMPPAAWAQSNISATRELRDELAQLTQRLIERALERKPRGNAISSSATFNAYTGY